MTSRRAATVLLALGAIGLLGASATACGGSDEQVTPETRAGAGSTTSPATTAAGPAVPGTVPSDAAGVTLDVFFLRGAKLGTAHRRVAPTQAVGRAALEQLLAGPDTTDTSAGLSTGIAAGTRLDSLDIANGVATVTFSPAVTTPTATGQVVFTLTQFPTVHQVRFASSGQTLGRDDVTGVLPNILLESVAPGDRIASPVTVAGLNNTFESSVRVQVLGADRRVLADTVTTGTGGMGSWGPFSVPVTFAKGADTNGFVVVFDTSAKDGSTIDRVEVPVRLL